MSKWASVTVITSTHVAIEVEDDDTLQDAEIYAIDHVFGGDGDYETRDSYFEEDEHSKEQLIRLADKCIKL